MPITNFSKPSSKQMVMMSGISSYGLWLLQGARVSELLHIKAEHIQIGHLDLYSKGGKIRRLYIPKNLRTEAAKWLREIGLTSGLHLSESVWTAHYYSWNSFSTQTFC